MNIKEIAEVAANLEKSPVSASHLRSWYSYHRPYNAKLEQSDFNHSSLITYAQVIDIDSTYCGDVKNWGNTVYIYFQDDIPFLAVMYYKPNGKYSYKSIDEYFCGTALNHISRIQKNIRESKSSDASKCVKNRLNGYEFDRVMSLGKTIDSIPYKKIIVDM